MNVTEQLIREVFYTQELSLFDDLLLEEILS